MVPVCLGLLLGGVAMADQATLTVNVAQPGPKVSPLVYGLFFEEINHAGDGGLYGELVRDRGFEDADSPQGWSLVTSGGAQGTVSLATDQPLNEKTPHSLRLDITEAAGGRVGVANEGYWGIAIQKGAEYDVSFFARRDERFTGPLTVSLEHPAGAVYAEQHVTGLATDWRRFECSLVPGATDPAARLVIAVSSPGSVWLDVVSLFPKATWKDRRNGLRADLAQMLADMKPSFVRFPGGCFVEGDQLANAFRWKDTIGDIADRPGHWNLWGYRSTDGLGYHEYLQMCEDLGAEPLFVINCGMAHGGNVPLEELDPWVQDALDAIEYANGPADSQWGALRAARGHPKPFGLKYMEIGNENGGPAYEERYARFYDAIKAKYPDLQLICDVRVTSRPMDIVDEHYYSNPEFFIGNAHRYDHADRQGPRIYVGEYAVTQNCGQGNLRAALGEAAFMTGLERNADVVVMASYAPLFVNVSNRAWNPDAICFNSSACYGTPSYHVQRLFGENRGEVVLPSTLTCDVPLAERAHGGIGLATWVTRAEFKDIKVVQGDRVLYAADFSNGAADWRVVKGNWAVEEGAYRQGDEAPDMRSIGGDPAWTDYTYTLRARKLGGGEGFLIMFRVRDSDNWYWWNLGGWGNVRHSIEKCVGGGKSELPVSVPGSIETDRWYDIKIDVQGPRIRCTLDGHLTHDVEDHGPEAVSAVASRTEDGEIILKVVNTSPTSQYTEVNLEGAGKVAPEGTATILTSNSPEDENSFAQPTRVAPVTQKLTGLGASFRYTFLPNSVTVLRLGRRG